jgi:uncharacterized protein YkwD
MNFTLHALALLLFLAPAVSSAQPTERQPARLAPEQDAAARKLLATLRRPQQAEGEHDKAVARLVEIGGPAVEMLVAALKAGLDRQLGAYGQKLHQQATALTKAKLARANGAEIAALRQKVLGRVGQEALTSEAIKAEIDPVMAQLRALLLVDANSVLESAAGLKAERAKIVASGRHWEQLRKQNVVQQPLASLDDLLASVETAALEQALPVTPAARATLNANAQLAGKLDADEAKAIEACNAARGLLGLAPLAIDPRLCAAARDHSADMEKLNFFDHTSPVKGKEDFATRARNFGTMASAENIYQGSIDGRKVTDVWFHSPPHQKSLLGNYTRIGVGRSGKLYTAMFGN